MQAIDEAAMQREVKNGRWICGRSALLCPTFMWLKQDREAGKSPMINKRNVGVTHALLGS